MRAESERSTRAKESAEPGYGLTVIPLQYVSGTTLAKLLEGFATRPGAIRTDPSGKLLIVVGTGSERQSAMETVRSFDVDWLRGQSVGMYPVQNSTPEPIVSELEKIMDSGDSGLGHGLVKFQPISRLNSILVVAVEARTAPRRLALDLRLDEPSTSSASVKVYKVRYGDAKQIAQLLQQIFETNGGAVSAESPTNEIAPGSGVKAMTAADRLTGGVGRRVVRPDGWSGRSGRSFAQFVLAEPRPIPIIPLIGWRGNPRTAAAQFGGVPVAALNSELSALGQGGSGGPQLPNVRITADLLNNSVLIYARPDEYKLIERTLIQLDRPKLQVAIDVTIAEVDLNDQLNYGVQFFLAGGAVSNTVSGTMPSIINNVASNTGSTTTGTGLSGGLNIIAGNPAIPARRHQRAFGDNRRQDPFQSFACGRRQRRCIARGGRSGSDIDRQRERAQRQQRRRQHSQLHEHGRYPARPATRELQRVGSARHRPTGQRAVREPLLSPPRFRTREVKSSISVVSGQTVLLAGMIQDQQTKSR